MNKGKNTLSESTKRLLLFMKENNISGYKIHKDIPSISQQQISHIRNGRNDLSIDIATKISNIYNVPLDWLINGSGEMLKSDKPFRNEVTPVPESNYMMVEYVDLRASAGKLGGADVEQLPETHKRLVPKEYNNGGFLVIRVDGDSMDDGTKRSLSDGDEVLIYEKKDCKIDELPIKKVLFVITSREGNVLKQITEVNTEEKYIVCHSFNNQYPDFKIFFEDIYQIFIVCKVTQKQISLI